MKLKGHISIGVPQCSNGRRFVCIQITDELSGCRVVEIEMELEAWALALASSYQDCIFDDIRSPCIGKRRERKTVPIKHPDEMSFDISDARLRKAVAPYEVDGWTGDIGCFRNHHKRDRETRKYNVSFVRWVDVAGGTP